MSPARQMQQQRQQKQQHQHPRAPAERVFPSFLCERRRPGVASSSTFSEPPIGSAPPLVPLTRRECDIGAPHLIFWREPGKNIKGWRAPSFPSTYVAPLGWCLSDQSLLPPSPFRHPFRCRKWRTEKDTACPVGRERCVIVSLRELTKKTTPSPSPPPPPFSWKGEILEQTGHCRLRHRSVNSD